MIEKLVNTHHIDALMAIWLNTNISAHDFIPERYWRENYEMVKKILPDADIYTYNQNDILQGFVEIIENSYIAGLFVLDEFQSKGIGGKLISYCKEVYNELSLDVYSKNINAVNFYLKNDFKISYRKIDENTQEEELHMVWSPTQD